MHNHFCKDNEIPAPQSNGLLSLFDLSPEKFPWRHPIPQEIETRRAQLSDRLIFDLLLSPVGIMQPDTFFPPRDVVGLQRLLGAITNAGLDELKRSCLIFF